jgi:1-phosphofructokinase
MNNKDQVPIITITLNPALDHTVYVSRFQVGQVNRVHKQLLDPGGKGINVAKVIRSLGQPVWTTGFLGTENTQVFYEDLRKKAIDYQFVEVSGAVRVNIKIVDDQSGQVSEVNFPGLNCNASDLKKFAGLINGLAIDHPWFVISGSLPPGLPDDTYRQLIGILQQQGAKVLLDSSGLALREGIKAAPFAIKPNLDELGQLLDRPLADEAAIKKAVADLLDLGVQQVIVTLGARGAIVANRQELLMVKPPAVSAKSTVGAGDAMVAGFMVGQARGLSLRESARLGTAAATASVVQPGTQAGSIQEVEDLLEQVQIENFNFFTPNER